jgi:uncharacterized protein
MRTTGEATVDLDSLGLRSGEAERIEMVLRPAPPVIGGESMTVGDEPLSTQVDISRTSSGHALRLRATTTLVGTCARCAGAARMPVEIDAREVEQSSADDEELRSPYVADGILDVGSWVHDALTLAVPEQILCRPDCAGLCEVCGVSFNEVDPATHRHERPPDPRFAKLRELGS